MSRKDPDRLREYRREWMRRRYEQDPWALRKYAHGRDIADEYAVMWAAQDGRCYLCGDPLGSGRRVHIEHDHRCCPSAHSCAYCRRGLACDGCNTIIARAGDDPARLRLIADHLEAALAVVTARLMAKPSQLALTDLPGEVAS